jgi:glycolate oxidase
VSNHGGRQLDHAIGTLDTLREVTEVVQGRVPIVLDGGVQRATDILKAIAMGAQCVAIGRLSGYGLAANGKDGLVRVLEILEHEMISAMGLLGITRIDELGPEFVRDAESVTSPHEMSSWVNMPGPRLL